MGDVKIYTYQTYRKKYLISKHLIWKRMSTVMLKNGFNWFTIYDIEEDYGDTIKPRDIIKNHFLDNLSKNNENLEYIVYDVWVHRDGWGRGIDIFYK